MMRRASIALVCVLVASALLAQKRKNKKDEEPRTQALVTLPDTPEAVTAETARLSFQTSPLSANGLLSQQVRDALKALNRENHGAPIVKLRAFVAGSGDLRRVREIVSEEFTDRKQALPTVTTVRAGALPMIGAQVVLEATSTEKRAVNALGLAFFSAIHSKDSNEAVAALQKSTVAAGVKPGDVLRITCFLSTLDEVPAARKAISAIFPSATADYLQTQREVLAPFAACEGIGRLSTAPSSSFAISNGIALVNSPKVVLTAAQLVFRDQDADIRLAFQRLGKTLEMQGASFKDVFWTSVYSLTLPIAAKIEARRFDLFDKSRPPAGTALLFEALPSIDATASVELMAAHE